MNFLAFCSLSYSLYTSFMIEMIDFENRNGLKGQYNLAQGPPADRPGFESEEGNRPRDNVHKRENFIPDERDDLLFHKK